MNNTKHTSSTDKAEISFLRATFQFIQPNIANMFKIDRSVRTTYIIFFVKYWNYKQRAPA